MSIVVYLFLADILPVEVESFLPQSEGLVADRHFAAGENQVS